LPTNAAVIASNAESRAHNQIIFNDKLYSKFTVLKNGELHRCFRG